MLYFKNNELAETYHVSLRTVLNWIESAKQGKLDLVLHEHKNKTYIANTGENVSKIEQMVQERRKYRNTRGFKVITPKPEFYEIYKEQQVFDIISNLETYHEIPVHYSFFGDGAYYWDRYTERMAAEDTPNQLKQTINLLDVNICYIDSLIEGYDKVNIVDIGVGNALPLKAFITRLIEKGVMGRYIGIDISAEMLEIARKNIENWFGNKIEHEWRQADIGYDRFNETLATDYFVNGSKKTMNLVCVIGGTLTNLRSPDSALRVIHDSMGPNDFLIETEKLDTPASRTYFDFSVKPGRTSLAPNETIVDLLNIDESFYDAEMGFNEDTRDRYIRARLKVAITINFKFAKGERPVSFNKGDTIRVYRTWHHNTSDILHQRLQNELTPIHLSLTKNGEHLMTISRLTQERVE